MLDTRPRPQTKQAKPARRPARPAAAEPGPKRPGRPERQGPFVRRDVVLGAATGLAVALGFGAPILAALGSFWSGVVLPAFYTLAQSGLPFCG